MMANKSLPQTLKPATMKLTIAAKNIILQVVVACSLLPALGQNCDAPTGLTNNPLIIDSRNAAIVDWNAATGADHYFLIYRPVGHTSWLASSTANLTDTVYGLQANTSYEWQVRTFCTADETVSSGYSSLDTFTSTNGLSCDIANGLGSLPAVDSVTLSWNAVPAVDHYYVLYRLKGSSDPWQEVTTSGTTSAVVNGLTSDTEYEWQMKAFCTTSSENADGADAYYSELGYFETLAIGEIVPDVLEIQALRDFYENTGGDSWTDNSNWPSGTAWDTVTSVNLITNWFGITVVSGDVTQLILRDNNLTGSLQESLGNLIALETLALMDNNLNGTLEPFITDNLLNLTLLELRGNNYTGSIPESIGNLTNLIILDFRYTNFDGLIPQGLGNLTNLETLRLESNSFDAQPLPDTLRNLVNLRKLIAFGDSLTGPLPEWIGSLANLHHINLSVNNFTGGIPSSYENLTGLTILSLHSNQLDGAISPAISGFSGLISVQLQGNSFTTFPDFTAHPSPQNIDVAIENNQIHDSFINPHLVADSSIFEEFTYTPQNVGGSVLTGTVPDDQEYNALVELYLSTNGDNWVDRSNWFNGTSIDSIATWFGITVVGGDVTRIDLPNNNATGPLPNALGDLPTLTRIDFTGSSITGILPDSMANLTALTHIYLNSNQITELPSWIGDLTALKVLNLGSNALDGSSIPASITDLVSLELLILDNNGLIGSLPANIGDLINLQQLQVHFNQLSGPLPTSLRDLSNLTHLHIYNNLFSGTLRSSYGGLTNLVELLAGQNDFTGSIPGSFSGLVNLKKWTLSNNEFTGDFPSWIGSLTQMITLTFHENDFTGSIPAGIGNLTLLDKFWVGGNEMSGSLPSELGNCTALTSLYLYNNNFVGTIPSTFSNLVNLEEMILSQNSFTGDLPAYFTGFPNWIELKLIGNDFSSIPDFSAHSNAANLTYWVYSNKLDFGDLEPNFTATDTHPFADFVYHTQPTSYPTQFISFVAGASTDFTIQTGGTSNQYQWERSIDGVWTDIIGQTNTTFSLASAANGDAGTYRCRITNTTITDLTLYSETVELMEDIGSVVSNRPTEVAGPGIEGTPAPPTVSVTPHVNYVRSFTSRVSGLTTDAQLSLSSATADVQLSTTYIDGLGRPVQTVVKQESPLGRDIVQPVAYDAFGRQPQQFLPYTHSEITNPGEFRRNALEEQHTFYQSPGTDRAGTGYPYSGTVFESSPLNRPLSVTAPGETWRQGQGRGIKTNYLTNTQSENVHDWDIDPVTGSLSTSGRYTDGALIKTETIDEHENSVLEYTDKRGRVVLRKVEESMDTYGGTNYLQTYYAYDDFDNLRYVLPPELAHDIPYDISTGNLLTNNDLVDQTNVSEHGNVTFTSETSNSNTYLRVEVDDEVFTNPGMSFNNAAAISVTPEATYTYYVKGYQGPSGRTSLYIRDLTNNLDIVFNHLEYALPYQAQEGWISATFTVPAGVTQIRAQVLWAQRTTGDYMYIDKAILVPGVASATMSATDLDRWAFQYQYDERQRMIEKQVPGAEPMYMVYDKRDRLVLTQDGNQRDGGTQWVYTKFDALNRPIITGFYTAPNQATRASLQADVNAHTVLFETRTSNGSGYTNTSFPAGVSNGTINTVTHYDDYSFPFGGQSGYAFVSELDHTAPFSEVKGLATGSRLRVLNAGFLLGVTYYDDYGRVIQTITLNNVGGRDRVTTSYDFVGNVQESLTTHNVGSGQIVVKRVFSYDDADRLLSVTHQVDNEPVITLAAHTYNELGELASKELGEDDQGNALQTVDYQYNIRGWLTHINNADLTESEDHFGMELFYDQGYDQTYYNGNIAGVKWQSTLDGEKRSYGYLYDHVNRITGADFVAQGSGTGAITWNANALEVGDHSVDHVSYDRNGNIEQLKRFGLDAGARVVWDDLSYSYDGNQLLVVDDIGQAAGFTDDNNASGIDDYAYDDNGNMISDENKDISSITYNYLNLPETVTFADGNQIVYTYDATGIKHAQEVIEGGTTTKTTDYAGEFIYENDTLVQISHEEGRIVPTSPGLDPGEYQFYHKDHLGNIRMTFTAPKAAVDYIATMEPANATNEEALFSNIASTRHPDAVFAANGTNSALLNGNQSTHVGPAKSLQVGKGDVLDISVLAAYEDGTGSNNASVTLATLISALAGSFGGVSGGTTEEQFLFDVVDVGLSLFGLAAADPDTDVPRAYINYMFFDENFVPVPAIDGGFGYIQVSSAAKFVNNVGTHELLQFSPVVVPENGFVYIYVSNESTLDVNVFFDDLSISHTEHAIVQEDHYYPFGLTLGGIGKQGSNPFKYNGKETQDELNLGWIDYGARMYDPAIGRWGASDPMAQMYYPWSPYNYTLNNPILFIDPDGTIVEFSDNTSKKDKRKFMRHQRKLNRRSKKAKEQWRVMKKSLNVHTIHVNETDKDGNRIGTMVKGKGQNKEKGRGTNLFINLDDTKGEDGEIVPIEIIIGHEEAHVVRNDQGLVKKLDVDLDFGTEQPWIMTNKINEAREEIQETEEREASHIENIIRAQYDPKQKKLKLRTKYSGLLNRRLIGPDFPTVTVSPPINIIKEGYRYYRKKKKR